MYVVHRQVCAIDQRRNSRFQLWRISSRQVVSRLGSVASADELECVFMFKRSFINKSQPTRYNRFNECMNPTINGDGQESSAVGNKRELVTLLLLRLSGR